MNLITRIRPSCFSHELIYESDLLLQFSLEFIFTRKESFVIRSSNKKWEYNFFIDKIYICLPEHLLKIQTKDSTTVSGSRIILVTQSPKSSHCDQWNCQQIFFIFISFFFFFFYYLNAVLLKYSWISSHDAVSFISFKHNRKFLCTKRSMCKSSYFLLGFNQALFEF